MVNQGTLLNGNLKTDRSAEGGQRPQWFSRVAGKHSFLGMKEKQNKDKMKGRLSSVTVCLTRVGQIVGDRSTRHTGLHTHMYLLNITNVHPSTLGGHIGIYEHTHTHTHKPNSDQTQYCICAVSNSVLTVWIPASNPIMINDSIRVLAVDT